MLLLRMRVMRKPALHRGPPGPVSAPARAAGLPRRGTSAGRRAGRPAGPRAGRPADGGTDPQPPRQERLQAFLARAGLGSRRAMDQAIAAGRVRVDRQPATSGMRVRGSERIEFDGRPVQAPRRAAARVLIYHKPAGEACVAAAMDLIGSVDRLPPSRSGRWQPMTRLDYNAAGLVLFSNDGAFADAVLRRIVALDAEFVVRVRGAIGDDVRAALREPVAGQAFTVTTVEPVGGESGSHHWYRIVLQGGRDRDLRALLDARAVEVSRIKQVRIGSLDLPRLLAAGRWMDVAPEAWQAFAGALGVQAPAAAAAVPRRPRPGVGRPVAGGREGRRASPRGDGRPRGGAPSRQRAAARPQRGEVAWVERVDEPTPQRRQRGKAR
jgi:23S rRNA pseudouridine2605 synthase